jgi:hypothetical protein
LSSSVVGHLQVAGHLAVGVVVAVEQEHRDARLTQPAHLPHEEEARVEVSPVAVVHVAGDDHEVHLLDYRQTDQVPKGIPRGRAQALGRRIRVGRQAPEGAVQVQICGVDEFHRWIYRVHEARRG